MNKHFLLMTALLLVTLLLRTIQLQSNPAGFFRDEADKGYTAYCLIQTGQDQTGKAHPLFVRELTRTTSAVYQYLSIPSLWLFGVNEFAVRLPAALGGTLSVLAVYLLARRWWGKDIAFWAGLFVCLSPWSLLLSRWANQSILLTASIPFAVYFFIQNQRERYTLPFLQTEKIGIVSQSTQNRACSHPSEKKVHFAAIFFLIAMYTYAPARLFIPVFAVLLWLLPFTPGLFKHFNGMDYFRSFVVFWMMFVIGCVPLVLHLILDSAESTSRLSDITILRGQPVWDLLLEWLQNYGLHLSPAFLFAEGDQNLRHNTNVFGQLHWYLLPLLLLGLWRTLRKREWRDRVLLVWVLCFPISAALTSESIPHALRGVFAVPVVHLIAAYGILEFQHLTRTYPQIISAKLKRALVVLWMVSVVLLPSIYLYDLFFRYPVYSAPHWQYGYQQAIEWWQEQRQPGEKVVVSGIAEYPYIFFLFSDRYEPEQWIGNQSIETVTFVPRGNDIQPYFEQNPSVKTYYLMRPNEMPNYRPTKSILLPGNPPTPIWKWVVREPDQ